MESLMLRVSRDPGWAIEEIVRLRTEAEKAEAELDALKCCGNCRNWTRPSIFDSTVCALVNDGDDRVPGDHVCEQWMHRILEATKEEQ